MTFYPDFTIILSNAGAFLPWRVAVSIPAIVAVPIFIGICFVHESPDWLNKKQRFEEMEQAASFYRRHSVIDDNICQCSFLK